MELLKKIEQEIDKDMLKIAKSGGMTESNVANLNALFKLKHNLQCHYNKAESNHYKNPLEG